MKFFRYLIALSALLLLSGCGRSCAGIPSSGPESILLATNPDYTTQQGQRQECIGRLVFDVPRDMEWGILSPNAADQEFGFSGGIKAGNEEIRIGRLRINIVTNVEPTAVARMMETHEVEKRLAIRHLEEEIKSDQDSVRYLTRNPNNEDITAIKKTISALNNTIQTNSKLLQALPSLWSTYSLDIPDSAAYNAGGNLYAYVWRDGSIYRFKDTEGENDPPVEVRKPIFDALVKRFRARKLYEIPKELGICFPYGFVPDDGTTPYAVYASIRYTDTPTVVYGMGTEIGEEPGPEPVGYTAQLRAEIGQAGGLEDRNVKRFGPSKVKIGAIDATQGGVSCILKEGASTLETYLAYTGTMGREGSQMFPAISLDMWTYTRNQSSAIRSNPPPFKESKARYDDFLKSLRFRPTTPLMPELAALQKGSK